MTHGRGEHSLKISAPQLLPFWDIQCLEDSERKNDLLNYKGVNTTAPGTLGLLINVETIITVKGLLKYIWLPAKYVCIFNVCNL